MCKYTHGAVRKRIWIEAMALVSATDDEVFTMSFLCYSFCAPIAFSPTLAGCSGMLINVYPPALWGGKNTIYNKLY